MTARVITLLCGAERLGHSRRAHRSLAAPIASVSWFRSTRDGGRCPLLNELRLNGFIEGQNLTVAPGGFDVRNEHLPKAAALVKAAPDAMVAGPELQLQALQEMTRQCRSSV